MNKSIGSIVCLALVVAALSGAPGEARPKRSIYYAAAPVVAAVPVVQHSQVVHANPTTVVKTEQVRSGNHASYSYSTETRTQPIVQTHTAAVAAAPVAHVAPVAGVVPASAYYGTHHYGYYPHAAYYSPYSYVVGK